MRNWIRVTMVSVVATTMIAVLWSVVHGETELFDEKRSARDIEVMCGILNTSVNYAVRELGEPLDAGSWRSGSIDGYYLYKQGAVFFVPVPALKLEGRGGTLFTVGSGTAYSTAVTEYNLARTLAELDPDDETSDDAEVLTRSAIAYELGGVSEEERKKRQEQYEKQREEQKRRVEAYRQKLGQLEGELLEMVAQYGSTLTQVQGDEFVTLVLTPSRRFGGPSGAARMLSVPRSAIADYGAGKLTLEQLGARVLRYSSGSSPSGDSAVFGVGSTLFDSGAGAR